MEVLEKNFETFISEYKSDLTERQKLKLISLREEFYDKCVKFFILNEIELTNKEFTNNISAQKKIFLDVFFPKNETSNVISVASNSKKEKIYKNYFDSFFDNIIVKYQETFKLNKINYKFSVLDLKKKLNKIFKDFLEKRSLMSIEDCSLSEKAKLDSKMEKIFYNHFFPKTISELTDYIYNKIKSYCEKNNILMKQNNDYKEIIFDYLKSNFYDPHVSSQIDIKMFTNELKKVIIEKNIFVEPIQVSENISVFNQLVNSFDCSSLIVPCTYIFSFGCVCYSIYCFVKT